MDIIDKGAFGHIPEQRAFKPLDGVPSHVGNLDSGSGLEAADCSIEYAQTRHRAFLAVGTHQLEAYAYSQNRLAQTSDDRHKSCCLKILHRRGSLADSRHDHVARPDYGLRVGSDLIGRSEALKRIFDRTQIAGLVVNYRNHKVPLLDGSS